LTASLTEALSLTWLEGPAALLPLQAEWQVLADRTGADPYLMPVWNRLWWRHFGAGRRSLCLVARQEGRLVGLLPFCVERLWLGPLPLRIARLAGTDPHCMVFALPLEPGSADLVLAAALRHLTADLGCTAVSFTPVSALARHLAPLQALCHPGSGLALVTADEGSHVVFPLPGSFEAYLGGLSKKRRGQFRRDLKGLGEVFGMAAEQGPPDAAGFDRFVEFHNRQWQALGRGGHFTDWPGSAGFYRDLAGEAGGGGMQLFSLAGTISGGVVPLATQFALVAGTTAHWRLPARSLDAEAERLSVGKVGLLLMIEALINQGVTRIEAGRGDYGYKLDYGGEAVAVQRLIVRPDTVSGALRLRLLLGWCDLLHLLHYRIWFLKLAPRLRALTGRKPRPLWRAWIRTRL
jgi:CelD/BcsL family acetyltransferase involved in cellulose biosynthesis